MPEMDPNEISSNTAELEKEWALKCKRKIKRFSEGQKNFLIQKFDMGDKSGMKCDPEDVSAEMRTVRDKKGVRVFFCWRIFISGTNSKLFQQIVYAEKEEKW